MVINNLLNPFFAELTVGIEHELSRKKLFPILTITSESPVTLAQTIRSLTEHCVSGLVICSAIGTTKTFLEDIVTNFDIPTILFIREIEGRQGHFLVIDFEAGALAATRYFINLGHRRIAFIGGQDAIATRRQRKRGYLKALAEYDLEPNLDYIIEADLSPAGRQQAVGEIM